MLGVTYETQVSSVGAAEQPMLGVREAPEVTMATAGSH